jgi:hypothetical protein
MEQTIVQRLTQLKRRQYLKDNDLLETAKPLEEWLFQFEALEQEVGNLFDSDPMGSLDALLEMLRGQT